MRSGFMAVMVAGVLTAASPASPAEWLVEVTSEGTMDALDGYFQDVTIDGSLAETEFLFEENGHVRLYAYKPAGQDTFQVVAGEKYIVKSSSVNIGDSWDTFSQGPAVATVVDTATLSVPAGEFFCYVIAVADSSSGSLIWTHWYCENVGWVKFETETEIGELDQYSVTGSGLHPLSVNNSWRLSTRPNSVDRPTWGVLKALFHD